MADKLTSPEDNDQLANEQKQRIFAERFAALMDKFGEACEANEIPVAIAIAIHPKENHPLIFVRGHQYDIASLLASVLRGMKAELISGLSSEQEINYENAN